MTMPDPTRPSVCGAQTMLPLALLVGALDMETARGRADITDVEEQPACLLQAHPLGAHHGIVMELDGPDTGAVWAVWSDGGSPHLVVLPDCNGATSNRMDACCHYAEHPGGHSYELHDPLLAKANQVLAAVRLPNLIGRSPHAH